MSDRAITTPVALRCCAAATLLALTSTVPAAAAVDARMFRYPDVSATQIAFVYAGDIWVVGKDGGTASHLSSPRGEEIFPRFSPDGSKIAFSASYDGNADVYVVPADGGTPERVTYHPAFDRLLDWTPDGGELLFASRRGGLPVSQLFRVAADGGLAEQLPVPYGEFAALSADGRRLAFTTKRREFSTWKRYRGGMAPEIWLLDLETLESKNLSDSDANDVQPMWHGETLYFLSDRGPNERYNLWALDLENGATRQVTHFTDFDITFPAIGPSDIVFQAGGRLHLLELAGETHREVAVEVVTDLSTLRPQRLDVGDQILSAGISPSGARAVVAARGEIFTLPAEKGVVRQLTRRSASAERYPAWSPDGEKIAYWSDRTGEYELTLRDAKGDGEEETLTELGAGYRYQLFWSPDSKKIAFLDNTQTIRILDVESGELTRVDRGRRWIHPSLQGVELAWSPDSRYLAYHRHLDNEQTAIFLFDTSSGEARQVTSGYYNDSGPVFDPGGEYLYYRSDRHLEPVYSDFDLTWVYSNATRLVAVPLNAEVVSPLEPRNDDEGEDEEDGKKEEGKEDEDKQGKKDKKGKKGQEDDGEDGGDGDEIEPVLIDLEGFEERAVVLPPEAGNYGALRAVEGKLVFLRRPRGGAASEKQPIVFYDLEEREEKTVLADAAGFEVSADGKKLLVEQEGSWAIVDLKPEAEVEDKLPTGELQAIVDPRQEWRQMFGDVWRSYRDNFYDPAMHGLDWQEVRERYGALLDDAVTRWDVNFVLGEVIGEINSSHTYVFGGDLEEPQRRPVGLLGVDWELSQGAYRIARILRGGPWDSEVRSPLAEPGLKVAEGDYVLAVNGVPIDAGEDPHAAFAGLAGETVELLVNGEPTPEGAREVLVETLESDDELRLRSWIEANRRRVDEASGGRIGYVYVRDTSLPGQADLVRQFTSQATRDGLIVDERWNQGGQLPDRFVELMTRQRVMHLAFRYQDRPVTWPVGTHFGPKAMLINGWAGSGGDAFPFFFREMGAGPLIGERTWGGLIGPAFAHRLIDGGVYTAPPGRLYGPDGVWFAEGHGVDPDIPVVDDPGELARGRDPQLEAAIADVMRRLETEAPRFPAPPPFESRVPAN